MKKSFLIVILFSSINAMAQKPKPIPSDGIKYDFANPASIPIYTIKPKRPVVVTLQNINPYLYDVTYNDSLIVYTTPIPGLFSQAFKIPDLKSVPSVAPAGTATLTGSSAPTKAAGAAAKQKESQLDEKIKTFLTNYPGKENSAKDALRKSEIVDNLTNLLSDCADLATIKAKADAYIQNELPEIAVAGLPLGIESQIEFISGEARSGLMQIIADGDELKKQCNASVENATGLDLQDYKAFEKDIKEKITVINNTIDNAKKLLEKLDVLDKSIRDKVYETSYNKILNSRIEKIITKFSPYGADELLINIKVKKKKEVFCAKEVSDFPISILITKGVKIDFSTGAVFNFGSRKFFDQKYHYDSVYRTNGLIADSVLIKRNANRNILLPSLGAFFHVYSRSLNQVNVGGMFGASIGTDQRLYYHIGGNLLIGKSDRLILGFGVSGAKAKILDGQYVEGQQIKRSLAVSVTPTEDVFRIGAYFSVTWNLNLIK